MHSINKIINIIMDKVRINNKNKNEQVLELFKSKQLVQYPSDQDI